MDNEFSLDPLPDAAQSSDPIWQRRQTSAMVCQPRELTFNGGTKAQQVLTKLVVQQFHRTQTAGTVGSMPQLRCGSLAFGHQLAADRVGHVVEWITVKRFVS